MIVGIDLGTTNSLTAYYKNGRAHIIPNRLNHELTPSIVAIDGNNTMMIGEVAKEYGAIHPNHYAKTFKRYMGTSKEIEINGKQYTAVELSSMILASLKENAEVYLGEDVEDAIISVPAYFNDQQRKDTVEAGRLAGLNVVRIINEPTASAIAYGVGENGKNERCLVFDLGGGTFDVSILEYFHSIMEVHAIAGDNQLGGEDFTTVLVNMFMNYYKLDLTNIDLLSYNNIYKACEKAKCRSHKGEDLEINAIVNEEMLSVTFTYEGYEKMCAPLLEKLRKPIEKAMRDARVTLNDIDRVLLVGGASRLPMIQDFVADVLQIEPEYSIDPDTSVVLGAALQCGMRQRDKEIQEMILTEVCPFTLGTEVVKTYGTFTESGHYLPIIERNTVIPVSKTERVTTAYDDQEVVKVVVLQGESRLTKNNLQLGELEIQVPKGPRGQEKIDITYTYDIDALLEVEVHVLSTNEIKKMVIQNQEKKKSEKEIQERLEKLQYLKRSPIDEEENYYVIYKAERLYEETVGEDRERIEKLLADFSAKLSNGDRLEIERARKKALEVIEEIEGDNPTSLLA